ncbi:MAG: Trk system potassium transporter TrkA [Holosporaceae bacterium]|jgi:trk system potassium uptake protein TrkA|nr:Trk system potassium transporter TrkA [Holosporaceae bacterium]
MNVLILGAGRVGLGVAFYLKEQDMNVTVVEESPELVFKIRNSSDINIIQGSALDAEVLKNANAENSTHLIATMPNDEQNILACKLADALFNVGTKIARIRSYSFLRNNMSELFFKDNFGIDMLIHPELEIAKYISDVASVNGAFDVIKLNSIIVVGLKCKNSTEVINTTFKHFQNITNLHLFVLTITRDKKTFFPSSDDLLLPEDEVYILTVPGDFDKVMTLFGYPPNEQNFLIVGGGNIGTFTIQTILKSNPSSHITLLEKSKHQAEKIAQNYPTITTILGNALDSCLLREISSDVSTAVIATNSDKINVLSSLLLKQLNVKRVLTIMENRNYDSLLSVNSGCSIVDPISITTETIIQKTRRWNITSAIRLKNSSSYVIEVEVCESCSCLGAKIEYLREKNSITPIFVIRRGEIIWAKKDIQFMMNDRLIILVSKDKISAMERVFSNYFFAG